MVFMCKILCMWTFHSVFQFLSYLRGNNMTTLQGIPLVLWTPFWHFKVPGYRSEEMLKKIWCIFMWTYLPICISHRNDKMNQTIHSRLTLHTTATPYLYLRGLQALPVRYKKMRFPTQHSHASLPWIVQIPMEWLMWLCRKFPCCDQLLYKWGTIIMTNLKITGPHKNNFCGLE
jgi:hypothetical protein